MRLAGPLVLAGGLAAAIAGLLLESGEKSGGADAGLVVAGALVAALFAWLRLRLTEAAEASAAAEAAEPAEGVGRAGQRWPDRDEQGHAGRYRLFSWFWTAAATGAAVAFGLVMLDLAPADVAVGVAAACAAAGGLVTVTLRLPRYRPDDGIAALDAPWPRRAVAAAFALGALLSGLAISGYGLLVDEWQRTPRGAAGVLAAAAASAAAALTVGRWLHRMDVLGGASRARAAGRQLTITGALGALGAVSFTYFGLIAAWCIAAGALALAAVALDAAGWSALHPSVRARVAVRQMIGAGLGALAAAVVSGWLLAGRHDQVKIAVACLPCLVVGWMLARHSPAEAGVGHSQPSWSRAVPLRTGDPDEAPLLRLEGVGVAYDGVQVVFDVTLEVGEGAVVALLGTNGAGKTTTLRAVSGLEPACEGKILYRGLDLTRTPPTWRVGMGLHQIVGGEAVAADLTVAENLRLFAHSLTPDGASAGIDAALEVFPRLAERRTQRAATLSGGEKQMLGLAKAFIVSPRLLLIDEFSLGLAPSLVAEMVTVVQRIAQSGTSVLLVEQSVDVACELADYAYVMEKGRIRHEGPTTDIDQISDLVKAIYLAGAAPGDAVS